MKPALIALLSALTLAGCAALTNAADHAGRACDIAEKACADYAQLPTEFHRSDVDARCAPWLRAPAAGEGAGGASE